MSDEADEIVATEESPTATRRTAPGWVVWLLIVLATIVGYIVKVVRPKYPPRSEG